MIPQMFIVQFFLKHHHLFITLSKAQGVALFAKVVTVFIKSEPMDCVFFMDVTQQSVELQIRSYVFYTSIT